MSKTATKSSSEHVQLSVYLRGRVRDLRTLNGWRHEDVAARANAVGLSWNFMTVSAVERGTRALSLDELLLLPAVFDLTLPELFDERDDCKIEIAPGVGATTAQIRSALIGDHAFVESTAVAQADVADTISRAERKAAAKLGVRPEVIMRVAKRLWGHSLAAERDERVYEWLDIEGDWNDLAAQEGLHSIPARSLQAHRAHMTRELLSELQLEIDKIKRRRQTSKRGKQ